MDRLLCFVGERTNTKLRKLNDAHLSIPRPHIELSVGGGNFVSRSVSASSHRISLEGVCAAVDGLLRWD